jgi:hypothetical protein
MVLNLGIARDLEIVGEFELANDLTRDRDEEPTRFEDGAVSLKWVFRDGVLQDEGTRPSLAVELSALCRRFEMRVGREESWWGSCPEGHSMDVPHQRRRTRRARRERAGLHVGDHWRASDPWAPSRGSRDQRRACEGGADDSALVGAVWSTKAPAPLHELSFDVGVRRGLSSAADDWGGTAGVTFGFPWNGPSNEERAR